MRVLLIKTSSLGDIIHTFPALTDAITHIPELRFDWVVEEGFQMLPKWHAAVDTVYPISFRRWRKNPAALLNRSEWQTLRQLKQHSYDVVLDAQGLFKSAVLTLFSKTKRKVGFHFKSAREPLASLFYNQGYPVAKDMHAIFRQRTLFAQVFGYPIPSTHDEVHYGISIEPSHIVETLKKPYALFFHGTTWPTKHWPDFYWRELAQRCQHLPYHFYLPWGNAAEKARAEMIADALPNFSVLPKLNLNEISEVVAHAKAAVAMDTGLGHIAAAFDVPTISLYGPTDPQKSGALGPRQIHLSSTLACAPCLKRDCQLTGTFAVHPPCFEENHPEHVYKKLLSLLN